MVKRLCASRAFFFGCLKVALKRQYLNGSWGHEPGRDWNEEGCKIKELHISMKLFRDSVRIQT
jgi:hypothetical protein